MSKLIASIWLLVISLFTICLSNDAPAASATPLLSIASTFNYDRQDETVVTCDGSNEFVISYDAVCVFTNREKENGAAKCRVPFAKFAEFLAAENTAMRFSRAGGASGDFLIPGEDALQAGLHDPALYGTRLTTTPTFNPTLTDLGVTRGSGLNASVEIGPGAFSSRENLIQTIIHEETHIRLDLPAAQGSQRAIGIQSDLFNLEEPYVESVAQRYWRMYGGR